jgi:hypothetical protein
MQIFNVYHLFFCALFLTIALAPGSYGLGISLVRSRLEHFLATGFQTLLARCALD